MAIWIVEFKTAMSVVQKNGGDNPPPYPVDELPIDSAVINSKL